MTEDPSVFVQGFQWEIFFDVHLGWPSALNHPERRI
jgi:hypothetical protein